MLPGHEQVGELVAPFVGWRDAWLELWRHGQQLWGFTAAVGSMIVGAAALMRRGMRHPLSWAIVLSIGIGVLSNGNVIGNNYGSTRALMPILVLGIVAIATSAQPVRLDTSPEHIPTGITGPGRESTGLSKR